MEPLFSHKTPQRSPIRASKRAILEQLSYSLIVRGSICHNCLIDTDIQANGGNIGINEQRCKEGECADMKPVVIVKCALGPLIVDIDIHAEGDDMDMED